MARRRFDRGWYPPSTPRAVEGGIKAKTANGAIGSSWWSRRFLDVLESFAMGGRLTRGRAYARKGQVISLKITDGEVTSSVQGSRAKPYEVEIHLEPFSDEVWEEAEIALAEQALSAAKLLAGEVPPELEEIFAAAGAPLFPTSIADLELTCSCPDWEVPCKHLAATFYLLAEAFDADPFLILTWRGREKDELLTRLRELRGDHGGASEATTARVLPTAGASAAVADLTWPEADPTRFWQPPAPLPPRPATMIIEPETIIRLLPEPPAELGGERLAAALTEAYRRLGTD